MSRLTRDGTAEPVLRDQILRHARGQGNIIFPVQLTTSRIGNLIHTLLYVMTIHTYILLTLCYYHLGNLIESLEEFLCLPPMFPPKRFDNILPWLAGCSEGLDAFQSLIG